ncbi:MAG: hypothetical protein WCL16_12010, partial [bacterium]
PVVAVLVDDSASMRLPAGPFVTPEEQLRAARVAGYDTKNGQPDAQVRKLLNGMSRAKFVHAALTAGPQNFLNTLAATTDVRMVVFDLQSCPVPLAAKAGADAVDSCVPQLPDPVGDGGAGTALGDAVLRAVDDGGSDLAAIVLFSDGRNTAGEAPAEAARRLTARRVPLYAVLPGATNILCDAAVLDVFSPGEATLEDQVRVSVVVGSTGLDCKRATLELYDGDVRLTARDLVLRDGEPQSLDLTYKATTSGVRRLTVRIPPLTEESESCRANNAESTVLRVSSERLRVLYIEGLPRWDYRFLKNAMRRDHGLGGRSGAQPDLLLEAELRRLSSGAQLVPHTVEELSAYHVVILGDVSPQLLTPSFLAALDQSVRGRGVGLIVQAGTLYMPHMYGRDFQALLPVQCVPGKAGIEAPAWRPFRMRLSPEGASHAVMALYDDSDANAALWSRMAPFPWCAAARRPAAGASVLAWTSGMGDGPGALTPLVAFHFAGLGRVMFVGTDATWLWRRDAGDRFQYKFWGQAMRYVARPDFSDTRTARLSVAPLRVAPGGSVQVELFDFEAASGGAHPRTALVEQLAGDEPATTLALAPEMSGRFCGVFKAGVPGLYRVSYTPSSRAPVVAEFVVLAASGEGRHTSVDRATLELLAAASGGALLDASELSTLAGRIKAFSTFEQLHREATLWDNGPVLVLLVLLYAFDVALRRLNGMA